jgi:hypothetical protein
MPILSVVSSAVLPSGGFAEVRGLVAADWLLAGKSPEPIVTLIERLVLVDAKTLSIEDILLTPLADYFVLVNLIGAEILKAKKTENGVK